MDICISIPRVFHIEWRRSRGDIRFGKKINHFCFVVYLLFPKLGSHRTKLQKVVHIPPRSVRIKREWFIALFLTINRVWIWVPLKNWLRGHKEGGNTLHFMSRFAVNQFNSWTTNKTRCVLIYHWTLLLLSLLSLL